MTSTTLSTKTAKRLRGLRAWPLRGVTLVVGLLFLAPFGFLVVRNLGAGAEFWSSFTGSETVGPLARSLTLAVSVTAAASVLGASSAWLVTRTDVPVRRAWQLLLALRWLFRHSSELSRFLLPSRREVSSSRSSHRSV